MNWITWTAVLVAWPLAGLGLAYLFGRFKHEADVWGDLAPPLVSYLHPVKREKAPSRAAHKARREAGSGRR